MTETKCEHPLPWEASEIGPDSKCAQCGGLLLTVDQSLVWLNTGGDRGGLLLTDEQAAAWLKDHPEVDRS